MKSNGSFQIRIVGQALFFTSFLGGLLAFAGATSALAAPVLNSANNHYYEAVSASTTWGEAKSAAEARTYSGLSGHLVTITRAEENQFLVNEFPQAISGHWWLGGYQNMNAPGFSEPAGGWQWVTGEPFSYASWLTAQPDNNGGNEHVLQYFGSGTWNDYLLDVRQGGYIVEYDSGDFSSPSLSVNSATILEGNNGTASLSFTVSLSQASTQTVTVHYSTQNGTASSPQDYVATSGDLTFVPNGALSQTIQVPVMGDTDVEPIEYFDVVLSSPTNASLAYLRGKGTIVNDDAASEVVGRIAFQSTRHGNSEIYTIKPDGTDLVRITTNSISDDGPAYSPTGNRIAFSSSRTGSNDIVTANAADGSDLIIVTDGGPNQIQPTWRPDGTRLAFSAFGGQDYDIYTIEATGGAGTRIVNNQLGDYTPEWSPNGNKIAFITFVYDAGTYYNHIFTVRPDGSGQAQLTFGRFKDSNPAWSPDGSKIAFNSDRDGDQEIYVMNADGSGQTRLTTRPGYDGEPTWSPDGNRIAFVSHRNNNDDIYLMNADGTAEVRLTNDIKPDSAPSWGPEPNTPAKPYISISNVTIPEGNEASSDATFTVTLSAATSQPVTVDFATANNTAIAGTDYSATTGTISFDPNETSKTFTVPILGDALDEDNKAFFINLSNATNAVFENTQVTVTITDDDPTPQLSIDGDFKVLEGDGATITFTATVSQASSRTVTVQYSTSNGTATGGDFQPAGGTLSFAPGETTKPITVNINNDTTDENDEMFFVSLFNAINATLPPVNNHHYELVNSKVTWEAANTAAQARSYEGVTGHLATITSAGEKDLITSQFGNPGFWLGGFQAPGTSEPNGGWQWVTGEAWNYTSWNYGEPNDIGSNEDAAFSGGNWNDLPRTGHIENYLVEYDLAGPVEGLPSRGMATIIDEDDAPLLSINDPAAKLEGSNGGQSNLTFTVSLSQVSGKSVTVDYLASDQTASAPDDYISMPGSVTIPAGALGATFTVPIVGDTLAEGDVETFAVTLSNAVNATIADEVGVGSITDDDGEGVLSVDNVSRVEGNGGATYAVFTVQLSDASTRTINVNYTTAPITAAASSDYQTMSGSLTFAPGDLSKTISVPIFGDTVLEPDELFQVKLSNATNAVIAPRVVRNPANNHYYELVTTTTISTWEAANTAAQARTFGGVSGHLATITSGGEQSFVSNRFGAASFFLGGFQDPEGEEPNGGWQWVTEEEWNYTNWRATQPDNAGSGENVLFHQGNSGVGWNDAGAAFTHSSFLVEYDLDAPPEGVLDDVGLGEILNDDGPAISINDITVFENNTGTASAVFNVTLSTPGAQAVTVNFVTADGTATAGTDYESAAGTITFDLGQISKTVSVPLTANAAEGETFVVNLSSAVNAWIADAQGVATVTETQPDLQIKSFYEPEAAYGLNDVYQSTPSGGQIESLHLAGTKTAFRFKLQNDSPHPRGFLLKTVESPEAGWTLVYKAGNNDIGPALRSALGYATPVLASGASQIITLEMTRSANTTGSKTVTLNAFLPGDDSTVRDTVRAVSIVDATAPTASFTNVTTTPVGTSPIPNGTVWNKLPLISGTAADAGSGVSKVELQLYRATATAGVNEYWNGNSWVVPATGAVPARLITTLSPTSGGANVTWSVNAGPPPASFGDGVYFLRAFPTDKVDRHGASPVLKFTKATDAANPTVGFTTASTTPAGTTPANNVTITGAMPSITGVAADANSGVSKVELQLYRASSTAGVNEYWNGNTWVVPGGAVAIPNLPATLNPAAGGLNVTWSKNSGWPTDNSFGNGIYYLRAYATDNVGKRTATAVSRFTKASAASPMPQHSTPSVSKPVTQSSDVRLSSLTAQSSGPSIELAFSGALDSTVAQDASHYTVEVNGVAVTLEIATYNAATKTVTLQLPSTSLNAGDDVSVSVLGLNDDNGQIITEQSAGVVAR